MKSDRNSDMEELFISSPSPEPIRLPKATLRRKRVEVVVKKEGKAPTREPSVITIQDSSDSDDHILEETNTRDNRKVIGGRSDARLSKEQAPYTRKRKANFQDPSRAAKRAVALEDRTRQLPKRMQGSSQTKRARFRIASLFDTDSSGADEPKINNPKGHKSQMSVVVARAQEATVTDLSKVPRASKEPHLDARKSSPIKSEFVSSVDFAVMQVLRPPSVPREVAPRASEEPRLHARNMSHIQSDMNQEQPQRDERRLLSVWIPIY